MSEEYRVTLPKLGESIVAATVVRWFKKEGEWVNLDEPLLEVSTDKVNSEIPSPAKGVLKKILVLSEQELAVGGLLGIIQVDSLDKEEAFHSPPSRETQKVLSEEHLPTATLFSPAVLRLAQQHGISLEELKRIVGTGREGRLSKRDIEKYFEEKRVGFSSDVSQDVETVKMTGMKRAMAENMVHSFYQAPHATLITDIDLTFLMKLIQERKDSFLSKHGAKLTITSFIAEAISQALLQFSLLNSSLNGENILVKRFVNLGIAVSVEQGILVPVIKNCHQMDITTLAKEIADLSRRARLFQLTPDEVQEGTITLTNFGISGIKMGIPIIRYPEAAIIGMGSIQKQVVVFDDDTTFGVRSLLSLSLTFDHRIIDGMYGCDFLKVVKKRVEEGKFSF